MFFMCINIYPKMSAVASEIYKMISTKNGWMVLFDTKIKSILYIVHSYNSFQKDSINELANHFSDVTVLVRSNPVAEVTNYISLPFLNRFKLDTKIDKENIPPNVTVLSTPVFYAPLDSQYKELGKKHFKAVDETIKKNNIEFDIVHSHFLWSAGYVGAKLKERYGVPFVVTAHGYDVYSLPFKDGVWKENIRYVLNSADHVITVSNSNMHCIKELDVVTPISIIPNGYRSGMFKQMDKGECRRYLDLPADKKILVTVGNLIEVKGQKYLVEAISRVNKYRDDVLCFIIGGGALERCLQKQIDSLGLKERVILTGPKPHSEIPIWMNACDVFVLPSVNESFGVVQIEAMACGKPVVATYNGGSEEIIISDEHGLLVEAKDPQALAEMIGVALDREWDDKMILKYAEQFQWETVAEQIHKVCCGLNI